MQKRREAMRVAGWLGVAAGMFAIGFSVVNGSDVARLAGSYGIMLVFGGAWALVGLQILARHERRTALARNTQPIADQRPAVSR